MQLRIDHKHEYMVVRFLEDSPIPNEFRKITGFKSITYTSEECSVIVPVDTLPLEAAISVEKNWFLLKIEGILDFSLTGILNQLTIPLAENNISIFALSTYDTDYLLLQLSDKRKAMQVLKAEGHEIT